MPGKSIHDLKNVLTVYFPDISDRLSTLLKDENFRELAEDYLFCAYEVKQLSPSKNEKLIKEYQETLKELEEELLSYLNTEK
jgi:hypothetical protein